MWKTLGIMAVVMIGGALAGFSMLGGDLDSPLGGGDARCIVEREDAVLHIANVTDAETGEPIERIDLADPVVNGSAIRGWPDSSCDVPCSFGLKERRYQFIVTAPGYAAEQVRERASYDTYRTDGCGGTYTNGTRITIELEPD